MAAMLTMADMLQYLMFGQRVTAHGKQWVIIQTLPGNGDQSQYLAVEETATLPAPVSVIAVPRVAAPPPSTPVPG